MAKKGASPSQKKVTEGKKPIPFNPQWPDTREEFVKWFWQGQNGNQLIKDLNASRPHPKCDYSRRESLNSRPVIYCIVLNDGQFPGKDREVQWKLCKVGFTHGSTQEGSNNRMEQVMAEINRKYDRDGKPGTTGRKAKPSVLFKFPVGAVDTTPYRQTEERIRKAMGHPLKKGKAKEIGLACSTEWVLTTETFILKVVEKKKDGIDLFKDPRMKFNKEVPEKFAAWIQ